MSPTTIHKLAGLLLAVALAPAPQDETRIAQDVHSKDQLLVRLLELQRRVRGGELPSDDELAAGRIPREELLAQLDVRRAAWLGMEPKAVRDRLAPGFLAELDLLAQARTRQETGPLAEPSPLLTLMLDLEQELWREADRRRQRVGIKSPLDSGPLGRRLQPEAPATAPTNATATNAAGNDAVATPAIGKGLDARLVGQAHYRAGRYADALAAWTVVVPPEGTAGLEFGYQRADCLMQTGLVDEAITAWEKVAADGKETSWGAQAEFALKVARALQAVRAAQKTPEAGSR